MAIEKHGTPIKCQIIARGPTEVLAKYALNTRKEQVTARMHGEIARTSEGMVDLAAEISKHPDALWIRVKAIEADNENDNGDYFSREEIIKAYKSFEGVPVFTNHENDKVENAKGKVVLAEWDEAEGAVYCTMFVDRAANPDLARAIEEGYVTDVSMGTQVDYSVCSVCKNKAYTADSYCPHVKTMKGRAIGGNKVYEENYGLKFIEISVVTDGACKDCTIREVLDPEEYMVAAQGLITQAKSAKEVRTGLYKNSGQQEIELLNSAMDNIETVLRAMLDQRRYIDLEFMQNLTEVFAELQHVTDELVDQGYGSIQGGAQPPADQLPPMPENEKEQGPASPNAATTGPSSTGVGSITAPASSSGDTSVKMSSKDGLQTRLNDMKDRAGAIYEEIMGDQQVSKANFNPNTISKLASIWKNPSVRNYSTEVTEGDYKIVVGKEDILGLKGGKKIASLKVSQLDPDIRAALRDDRDSTAGCMLDAFKSSYAALEKTAESATADSEKQHEETMEVQLERENLQLHPREKDVRQSITEKQLDDSYHGYDWHTVQDDPRDETIELQLRNENWKGNATPAKGADASWAAGVNDQNQRITEHQLDKQWRSSDDSHNPLHTITEKQLRDDQGDPLGRRLASVTKDNAKEIVEAATDALRLTAKATGATPAELIEAISEISKEDNKKHALSAAASLDHPKARELRGNQFRRATFYGSPKTASKGEVIDYMLGSLSDKDMTPDVGVYALKVLASREDAEAKIAEALKQEPKIEKPAKPETPEDLLMAALDSGHDKVEASHEEEIRVVMTVGEVDADFGTEEFGKRAVQAAAKLASDQGMDVKSWVDITEPDADGKFNVTLMGTKKAACEDCDIEEVEEDEDDKADEAPKAPSKDSLASRSENRRQIVAQFGGSGGTTMPAPSPTMDPSADPAGGAMGQPGMDPSMDAGIGALSEDEGMEDEPGEGGEATPPGSTCPACGSDDVDAQNGEISCNNCGAQGTIEVNLKMKNWPGTSVEKGPGSDDMDMGMEGDIGGEAGIGDMEGGAGVEMPSVGLAMVYKITPEMVKKAQKNNIKMGPIGSFCPHCGSSDVSLEKGKKFASGTCSKCNGRYRADTSVDLETNEFIGRIAWFDRNVTKLAETASRQKKVSAMQATVRANKTANRRDALATALKAKGWTKRFANANLAQQAEIIGELAELNLIPKS